MPTPKDKRNYQAEYAAEGPKRREDRRQRMQARYNYEKKHGDLPASTQVDHKKALSQGGTNAPGNLRAIPKKQNESFKRAGPGGKQVGRA